MLATKGFCWTVSNRWWGCRNQHTHSHTPPPCPCAGSMLYSPSNLFCSLFESASPLRPQTLCRHHYLRLFSFQHSSALLIPSLTHPQNLVCSFQIFSWRKQSFFAWCSAQNSKWSFKIWNSSQMQPSPIKHTPNCETDKRISYLGEMVLCDFQNCSCFNF